MCVSEDMSSRTLKLAWDKLHSASASAAQNFKKKTELMKLDRHNEISEQKKQITKLEELLANIN